MVNKKDFELGYAKRELAYQFRREMTPSEARLWQFLRRSGLDGFHFRRQHIIAGFIADFYCHSACLVVEVDGSVHVNQKEYDKERDEIISSHGIKVLRFTNDQVENNINEVITKILETCRQSS